MMDRRRCSICRATAENGYHVQIKPLHAFILSISPFQWLLAGKEQSWLSRYTAGAERSNPAPDLLQITPGARLQTVQDFLHECRSLMVRHIPTMVQPTLPESSTASIHRATQVFKYISIPSQSTVGPDCSFSPAAWNVRELPMPNRVLRLPAPADSTYVKSQPPIPHSNLKSPKSNIEPNETP